MTTKDFAFLFYVNDWAGGVMGMNRLQRGGYLDLLLFQFHNKCFSLEEAQSILGNDFETVWKVCERKFVLDSSGNYFNEKMETVRNDRRSFCESRSKNKLGKTKDKKITRKTSENLMGNGNEDEKEVSIKNANIIENEVVDEVLPFSDMF